MSNQTLMPHFTTTASKPIPIHIPVSMVPSHASQVNSKLKRKAGTIFTLKQRWDDAIASATKAQKILYKQLLVAAKAEFKRLNPHLNAFSDLKLVLAHDLPITDIHIDDSVQRVLLVKWVLEIINGFIESMVVPIQVYKDSATGKYHAWDGQHTAIALWLIATDIFGEDPANVRIPVNINQSTNKAQTRSNFIMHNGGQGKVRLDLIDIFIQKVCGVRIDGSKNPDWILAEAKQQHIEKHDLFVTSEKFNDTHLPGAITRLPEINKMDPEAVGWLCRYLSKVGCDSRPADEKEMVMMGAFFDKAYRTKTKVGGREIALKTQIDDAYIDLLAHTAMSLWCADFSDKGPFWAKANIAYKNWHAAMNPGKGARFSKEPVHGMPFLMAQLRKSFPLPIPDIETNSEFVPLAKDLF